MVIASASKGIWVTHTRLKPSSRRIASCSTNMSIDVPSGHSALICINPLSQESTPQLGDGCGVLGGSTTRWAYEEDSIDCLDPALVTSIRRGLARSAIGIVTDRTPFS